MARSFSAASRLYGVGTYGPFSVDGFTNRSTTGLEWTATVENWPTDRTLLLAKVTMRWDTGAFSTSHLYGGPRAQDGTPLNKISVAIGLGMSPDANGNPVPDPSISGSILIEVFVPIRSALSLTALS